MFETILVLVLTLSYEDGRPDAYVIKYMDILSDKQTCELLLPGMPQRMLPFMDASDVQADKASISFGCLDVSQAIEVPKDG